MKLTYHCCGDYLLPKLAIPDEPVVLGKYSRMRKTYLKEHIRTTDSADETLNVRAGSR